MRLYTKQNKTLKLNKTGFMIPVAAFMGLGVIGAAALMQDTDYDASAATETVSTSLSPTDYYISLTAPDTATMDLAATSAGSYAYATSNVVAKTNVSTGYQLYMTAGEKGNTLIHSSGSSTGVISAASGTGGASGTPAVLSSNSFGYAVPSGIIGNNNFDASYDNPTASSKWAKVSTADTGDKIRTGNYTGESSAAGETTDVHFAVYANNAMAAGTYSGTVVYSMVADMPTVGLSIEPNTWTTGSSAQTVTVTSGPMVASGASISASDISITIGGKACTVTAAPDTSEGHLVTKCTAPTDLTGTKQSEGGTAYDVVITVSKYSYNATITGGYTVYAPDATYMQDLTTSWCKEKTAITSSTSSSIKDYTYEVVDKRTNEKYWVRKFGSLCWMVENLYMPSKQALTSSDTNMTAATYTMPESSTSGFSSNTAANMYSSVRRRNNNDSGNNDGSYFTWVAAKVGVNSTGTNNDVCPKNWRMPTNTEQQTVDTVAELGGSINNFYADSTGAAVSPVLPGYYSYSAPGNAGSYAYWWSSTQYNANYAYYLYSDSSSLTTNNSNKYNGFSVRCVLPSS